MDVQLLAYPFLFLALYFEVFLLLTFLSPLGRHKRNRPTATHTPTVAMIVPCYNEERTITGTVESLLALEYPHDKLRIILVDDGSTDGTPAKMDAFMDDPRVTVIHQVNGGKHAALNAGIACAPEADLVGCLDADSFAVPSSLREMISSFDDPQVAAATAAMSVASPKTVLERMQNAEYIFGIGWRHALSIVNGIYVTPGPMSLYRRQVVADLGGFEKGHNTEDMEMALRLQRHGWVIENAPRARVYTKVPKTIPALIKQRTRWTTGFLRNVLLDYRDLIGNPKRGVLGLMVLPFGFIAIAGGITLFSVVVFQTVSNVVRVVTTAHGIPLSYLLSPHVTLHSLNWFYLPISMLLLLGAVASTFSMTFMVMGKHISRTPGNLIPDMIAYALLYGLIAPWWLLRTVRDVIFGTRRSWR